MAERNAASRPRILPDLTTLLAAMVLLMFSNGRFPVAVCSWLGPLFMIHFTRGRKGLVRLPLAYLGLSFAFGYQFYGMTPFGGSAYLIFCASFGITLLLPYVADRYWGQRWNGLTRSLVFPLALITSEYLASFGPFGTWGSIAYSQYESLTLLQLLAWLKFQNGKILSALMGEYSGPCRKRARNRPETPRCRRAGAPEG